MNVSHKGKVDGGGGNILLSKKNWECKVYLIKMINLIFSSVFTTAKNGSVLHTFAEAAAIKNQKS